MQFHKIHLALFLLLFLLTIFGCAEDMGPSDDQINPLDDVSLSLVATPGFGRVHLLGLPDEKALDGYEVLLQTGENTTVSLAIEEDNEGYFFWAPLNPAEPLAGGTVTIQISNGSFVSPALSLDIQPLPPSPGSFELLANTLHAQIEQRAIWAGTSFEALDGQSFEEVETPLLPLKTALSYLRSDDGHDLMTMVDNDDGFLSADQRELLDRIFGFAPLQDIVQSQIEEFEGGGSVAPLLSGPSQKRAGCFEVGPEISHAEELSSAMLLAAMSNFATDPSTPAGQTLSALGVVLSGGGVIPGYGVVFSVAGIGLAVWQATNEYHGGVYPSSFVSLQFEIDRTEFNEDETEPAQWSEVKVKAQSRGWTADKAIANVVLSSLGTFLSSAQKLSIAEAEIFRGVAITGINQELGDYLDTQEGGLIEFCQQFWLIDITGLPYSTAGVLDHKFQVDTDALTLAPLEVGPDVLQVAAQPSEFGGQEIHAQVDVATRAIVVNVTPEEIYIATAGDLIEVTATIENANIQSLFWTPEHGAWQDGIGNATNGPGTRPLSTPSNEDAYPYLVTVESTSDAGLRASGEPPRLGILTVRLAEDEILVSYADGCVINDETMDFTATQPDGSAMEVTWSLEDPATGLPSTQGEISAAGQYTAPATGTGNVLVVATGVLNPNARGIALISFGTCVCFWEFELGGSGSFFGDRALHEFPSALNPVFLIEMDHLDNSNDDQPAGVVHSFSGPNVGETGSWPAVIVFNDGTNTWGAGDENTPATLTITVNTTDHIEGSVSGICTSVVGGETVLKTFNWTFSSGRMDSLGSPCSVTN